MTYSLNPEAKAFSYTREELFVCLKRIIEQDKTSDVKALAIFVVLDDYLTNYLQRNCDGEWCVYESEATDFIDFVRFKLGIGDYDEVNVDEILK
jgi:hypothetical protein